MEHLITFITLSLLGVAAIVYLVFLGSIALTIVDKIDNFFNRL